MTVLVKGYALVSMPDGTVARIPVEDDDPFDVDEAREFKAAAHAREHTNILAMLSDLIVQGLNLPQAVGVVCTYLDLLEQRGQRP